MNTFRDHLVSMNACQQAIDWAINRTPREAWEECEKPEWLFWYLQKVGVDSKLLTRAVCACSRLAADYYAAHDAVYAGVSKKALCDVIRATIQLKGF